MKKFFLVFFLISVSTALSAENSKRKFFFLGAGVSPIPKAENLALGLSYSIGGCSLFGDSSKVGFAASYEANSYKTDFPDEFGFLDENINLNTINLGFHYYPESRIDGFYFVTYYSFSIQTKTTQSYLSPGAGIDFPFAKGTFFLEARYSIGLDKHSGEYIPVRFGLKIGI